MRVVYERDGVLSVRWTWLPFWIGSNPKLTGEVEREMRDVVLLNAMTSCEDDLDRIHDWVVARIQKLFPGIVGLDSMLHGMKHVQES